MDGNFGLTWVSLIIPILVIIGLIIGVWEFLKLLF